MTERPIADAVGTLFSEPLAKLLMEALGVCDHPTSPDRLERLRLASDAFLSSIAQAPEIFFRNIEANDRLAEVIAALDRYDNDDNPADPLVLFKCVAAIAKAVGR